PILIHPDLPFPVLGRIESEKFWLPGILIEASPTRWYVEHDRAAHLLGYLGEVSPNELKTLAERGYRRGDVIGRGGLESAYESFLRGKAGALRLEIDASGREVKKIDEVDPEPGLTLELTLDLELQKTAEKLFDGHPNPGTVVALDPRNGEILVLLSRPAYDPNFFSTGVRPDYWKEIINHPDDPLENRAIRGQYPPGSTFKLITALAALEEKVISPGESLFCGGSLPLGRRTYKCWRKEGHGRVDIHKAIVQSCDVFFYRMGMRLGVDRIAKYAQVLGLGKKTGIEIPGEKSGLIPTEEWKLKTVGEPWVKGEDLSTAIGQGYVLLTPLQLVSAYAQLAQGGKSFQPHLVRRIKHPDGQVVMEFLPQVRNNYSFPADTREILRAGFIGVVNEPGGTGGAARLPGITVAGKTGTAQVLTRPDNVQEFKVPEKLRDHAWFVAYAPAENPEIAVVVLVEHGGHGASVAAPIA
ncbi:MAG: penicillin-binding protein 2, partial [bacterium]|nr:penicillin-binding protein 2 [bacterium]